MTLYYVLLAWMLTCALLTDCFVPRQRRVIQLVLCAIPAIAISSMRDISVGTDTMQYAHAVRFMASDGLGAYMASRSTYADYEPGFIAFLWVCSLFNNPVRVLIILSSLLIVGLQYYAISKLCDRPAIGFVLLFLVTQYYFGLSVMRQSIAASLVLIAVVLLMEDRRRFAFVFVFLAVLFHYTASIALPVFLFARKRVTGKVIKWFVIAAIAFFAAEPFIPILFSLSSKYAGYLISGDYLTPGGMMPIIQVLFFGAITFCLMRSAYQGNMGTVEQSELLCNMGIIASLIGVLVGVSAMYINLFYRFMYIVLPIIVVALTAAFPKRVEASLFITKFIAYAACILLFISFLFVDKQWFGIDPYVFMR